MQTFICIDLSLLNDAIVFNQRAGGGRGGENEGAGEGRSTMLTLSSR